MKAHVKELIREAWEKSISRDNKWRYDYLQGVCDTLYNMCYITSAESVGTLAAFELISDYHTNGKDYDSEELKEYLQDSGLTLEYLFDNTSFNPYKQNQSIFKQTTNNPD